MDGLATKTLNEHPELDQAVEETVKLVLAMLRGLNYGHVEMKVQTQKGKIPAYTVTGSTHRKTD